MIKRLVSSAIYHTRALARLPEVANRLDRLFNLERETFRQDLLRNDPRLRDPRCLNRFEFQLFSQSGQDGIIAEIVRRLGVSSGTFVEFGVGVGDGFETNTTALLSQGWSGMWIEASGDACSKIGANFGQVLASRRLKLKQSFVTAENIAGLLQEGGIEREFDLLSIDIDGNDLYVWKALKEFRPKLVVIEYNSYFPEWVDWTMPYRPTYEWDGSIEFGASALALARAGDELGYRLVACDLTGSDCFFVRADLCNDRFVGPFDTAQWYQPMRYYLINRPGYPRRLHEPFAAFSAGG